MTRLSYNETTAQNYCQDIFYISFWEAFVELSKTACKADINKIFNY
jgi:hypothetical protein